MALGGLILKRTPRGDYSGIVEFTGKKGDIKLRLDSALSEKVLAVVAEELICTSERLATQMTASLIQCADSLAAVTGESELDDSAIGEATEAVRVAVGHGHRG